MPYVSCEKSTTVTVQAVTITLDALPAYKKQGETVTFTGTVKIDTTGWGGVPVDIYMGDSATSTPTKIASGTTASGGTFSINWTVSYTLGCTTKYFRAYHPGSGTWSNARSMKIAFNTRISITPSKSVVAPGESFTLSGKLEYESTGAGVWTGLGGRTVSIYRDTTLLGTATTASDGSYSYTTTAPTTAGTYTYKAVYAGEGLTAVAVAVPVGVALPTGLEQVVPYALIALAGYLAYREWKGLKV